MNGNRQYTGELADPLFVNKARLSDVSIDYGKVLDAQCEATLDHSDAFRRADSRSAGREHTHRLIAHVDPYPAPPHPPPTPPPGGMANAHHRCSRPSPIPPFPAPEHPTFCCLTTCAECVRPVKNIGRSRIQLCSLQVVRQTCDVLQR